MFRTAALLLMLGLALAPRVAAADEPCGERVSPALARAVFEALARGVAGLDCSFEGLDTEERVMRVRLGGAGAAAAPPLAELRACPAGAPVPLQLTVPPRLAETCPRAVVALHTLLATSSLPAPTFTPRAARAEGRVAGPQRVSVPSRWAAVVVLAAALLLALLWGGLAAWRSRPAAPLVVSLLLLSGLALGPRLLIRPGPLTAVADVLPPVGPSQAELAVGAGAYQTLVRAVLPWSDGVLFRCGAVLGAFAVPLLFLLLVELGLSWRAAGAAAVLLALAPPAVRAAASSSEVPLLLTLECAAALGLVRGGLHRDRLGLVTALVVVATVVLLRPDGWAPFLGLGLLPLGVAPSVARPAVRRTAALWLGVWALLGGLVAAQAGASAAARRAPAGSEFLWAFTQVLPSGAPSLGTLVSGLALLGVLVMLKRHRGLLGCVLLAGLAVLAVRALAPALALGGAAAPSSSLFALPLALLPAGLGFGWLVGRLGPRPAAAAVVLLAAGALLLAAPALRRRTTFADEYAFLREALTALPDGCVVHQVALDDEAFLGPAEVPLDGCLSATRLPLQAAYGRLRWAALGVDMAASPGACNAYYRSAACSLGDTAAVRARHSRAAALLRQRCAALDGHPGRQTLAQARVSPDGPDDLFGGEAPEVRLEAWR